MSKKNGHFVRIMNMSKIFDSIETPYIDSQTILRLLSGYRKPRDWIARMVQKGELLRLKNGFFLILSRVKQGKFDYPYEQIANLLYGPSYVSIEWALSFYHFIPERVAIVTSVTTGSNKEFTTPIRTFSYRHLKNYRYSIGIDRQKIEGQLGEFLIATPEKALADWVYFTCGHMSKEELLQDLLEAKRIEKTSLQSLNKELLQAIGAQYKSPIVHKLSQVISTL